VWKRFREFYHSPALDLIVSRPRSEYQGLTKLLHFFDRSHLDSSSSQAIRTRVFKGSVEPNIETPQAKAMDVEEEEDRRVVFRPHSKQGVIFGRWSTSKCPCWATL
jgi:hypothetical protein